MLQLAASDSLMVRFESPTEITERKSLHTVIAGGKHFAAPLQELATIASFVGATFGAGLTKAHEAYEKFRRKKK